MTNELSQKIIDSIAPGLGEFIARSALLAACKRENIDIDKLSKVQLSKVAQHLEELMSSKVGPDVAKQLTAKIISF